MSRHEDRRTLGGVHQRSVPSVVKESARFVSTLSTDLDLRVLFERQAVREGYSVGEHTIMALTQLERYFGEGLPLLGRDLSRIFITLHDAGKRATNDTSAQAVGTVALIRQKAGLLGLSAETQEIFLALLSRDYVGPFVRSLVAAAPEGRDKLVVAEQLAHGRLNETLIRDFQRATSFHPEAHIIQKADQLAETVRNLAQSVRVDPAELFALMVRYFQIDASAYTIDAIRDGTKSFPNRELSAHEVPVVTTEPEMFKRYAELEVQNHSLRAYPSLEGLFEFRDDFSLTQPLEAQMLQTHQELRRLRFAPGLELAIQRIEAKLSSR